MPLFGVYTFVRKIGPHFQTDHANGHGSQEESIGTSEPKKTSRKCPRLVLRFPRFPEGVLEGAQWPRALKLTHRFLRVRLTDGCTDEDMWQPNAEMWW
uniref:Uncharacterized protein n=1 Tax=Panagrellus redivivus TaxID=6233 RepID=A0A7E4VNQ1_PANRE